MFMVSEKFKNQNIHAKLLVKLLDSEYEITHLLMPSFFFFGGGGNLTLIHLSEVLFLDSNAFRSPDLALISKYLVCNPNSVCSEPMI